MQHRYASISPDESTNPFPRVERGAFSTEDGLSLTWHRAGHRGAPTLVLANGIGGNIEAWSHLVNYFVERFQILSWDYRGLFDSEKPRDPEHYRIERHASDLANLLEHHKVDEPILIGWSMGAQVNLEYLRHRPSGVKGFIVINGTSGRPFQTAFATSFVDEIVPHVSRLVSQHWTKAAWLAPILGESRWLLPLLKQIGLVGHTADDRIFRRLAKEYARLDFGAWSEIFVRLGLHDATDMLEHVRVPALVIAGERDLFTPLPVARMLVDRMPRAELYTVAGGTHYCPLEFPELVSLRIEKYLHDRLGLR